MPKQRWYETKAFSAMIQDVMAKHGLSEKAATVIVKANGPSQERCEAAAIAFLDAKASRPDRKPTLGRSEPAGGTTG